MKQLLASTQARLILAAIPCDYTGSKAVDLVAYVRTLVPAIKIPLKPGEYSRSRDPAKRTDRIKTIDATALGVQLIKHGWYGKKKSVVDKETQIKREYVIYTPNDPYDGWGCHVILYRPSKQEPEYTRITLYHPSHASLREKRFLKRLNRRGTPAPVVRDPRGRSSGPIWRGM